ncbi:helix-turn-helix transcriptional regulator [Massilia rhizosphaerae]|uniref:helix-turn-helix transcriptional regulator n=1 Tax=Massilia rhizosphaerae TaxID=2784389 RepID=UPI0018DD8FC0|nr:helix-turn-helix transcriptional regulator [Massilia rhizosphaerae]
MTIKKPVGDAIREARNRKGISQAELAGMLSVSQAAVGQWERGTTLPRIKYIHLMANLFDESFRSDIEFSPKDELAERSSNSEAPPTSSVVQLDMFSPEEIRSRLLVAEHMAKAGDFDKTLAQALQRLDPTLKSHVTIGGGSDLSQWVVDYVTQRTIIEVKHPGSYYGIEAPVTMALFQQVVLRSFLGPGKNYVVVVRRPLLGPLPSHALPSFERRLAKLTAEANLVGVRLLVVDSAEEAAKAIADLEAASTSQETK